QLEATLDKKSAAETELRRNEKLISDLLNRIRRIEQQLKTSKARIQELETQQAALTDAKQEQQAHLAQQLRAAYKAGNQEYLKVLLNQEDPHEISRMLKYYDYFNLARAVQIEDYKVILMELAQVTSALADENIKLGENRDAMVAQRTSLGSAQIKQQHALAALRQEMAATGNEIRQLSQDRQQLESLLARMHRALAGLADIPAPSDAAPFAGMKGKLLLPVVGKVAHAFGTKRRDGKLTWDGVFINASPGEPVHAVHYGRVVFSDWLRGFGLIMIISHGDGYMSLYGHNQALYRQTGDWVAAGDVVAAVGTSGGQTQSGLYFEIRKGGRPDNPTQWCKARATSPNV
ncbi:MAG: murein hydrolase activator EnvC family protein, partial [Pseudomonadales bacterium]